MGPNPARAPANKGLVLRDITSSAPRNR
jgi:hypothetical protein